jgi:hypothetical protein
MTSQNIVSGRSLRLHIFIFADLVVCSFPQYRLSAHSTNTTISFTLSVIVLHVRLAGRYESVLMPSQYRLYPSMPQTNVLSCQSRELGQALSCFSVHSGNVGGEDFPYRSPGRKRGVPVSASNGSLIDFDIDTSDFMNMKSPFPWDDNQYPYRCTDPYHQVRYSFESSSSTIQGSYCSMKTLLLPDSDEAISEAVQSRESILIPDYPQDLACHHIKAYKPRAADLRTSSGESIVRTQATTRSSPSYKRSVTPSQLDSLAGALAAESDRRAYTPQRSFESSHTEDQPITPSLSFSSTVASSATSSIMSSCSHSGDIPAEVAAVIACAVLPSIRSSKGGSDTPPSGPVPVAFRPRQVQRKISGPLPNAEYPSMMNLTFSPLSPEIYNSERVFQPCRKTPKPPSSIPLPPSPGPPATQTEPPSWFDLDDDTHEWPSKHLNLPKKLSIPRLRLRSESSTKKTTQSPAATIKRRSEDSITIAANIVETTDVGRSCATSKVTTAHISFPSSAATLVQTKAPQAALKKKSSVRSKLLVPARGCTTETLKMKKTKKGKVGSSSKNKKRFAGRRLRAWFRRAFC